jgi:cation diffusion facilitator CzcD-associated flavoprotein CzcO
VVAGGIDHEALRQRYRAERDKRLRPDGTAQYVEPSGRFATLVEDHYTERVERPPRHDEVEVAVIGAGFAGLATGAMLVEAGIDDFLIIDGAGGVGGVWYWNRYPGAMCDTAAMVYLPLLEETGTVPSMKYVLAPEINAHAERMARRWDLHRRCLLSTQVSHLEWVEKAGRWRISSDRGDELMARYVTMGTGPLHRPKLPGIPGLDAFQGACFHTARWDYALTGGDPSGAPMTGLETKRVGIIGTGATAVQVVPVVARDAAELYVFQRTPSSIDVRNNHAIDPEWFDNLTPGWQSAWLMNFAVLQTGGQAEVDLVQDGWTDISKRIWARIRERTGGGGFTMEDVRLAYEESDDEKMEEIRARVDAVVEDPGTAAALKPWYRQLCKRPCFHDEYLQAFNRDNVHLVDTRGKGVTRIDTDGCWVGDNDFRIDVLVIASGFEVGTDIGRRCGFETVGRDGITLSERWAAGMSSLHGMHVTGFPNLFVVGPQQQANLISNITHNQVEAARTIAAILSAARERGATRVEVTPEAEAAWTAPMAEAEQGILGSPDCTPGYYNNEGGPVGRRERLNAGRYPGGAPAYFSYIEHWRTTGDFEGLVIR